jgi:peptidoglycan hydrolase CwlO-like protein
MDVQRTIEFLLAQQVRFDERQTRFEEWSQAQFGRLSAQQEWSEVQFGRLSAQQEQTSKEVQAIAGAVHVLIRTVDEDRAAMRELREGLADLREDVTRVTENVDALVKVVDDLVRRGNGRQHS